MMPATSRLLYYDFGMSADDDGYVEHFTIMRMTEAKPDDLKVLEARGFVKVFDDKVLIISDWKENNYIQKDRYTPSKYLDVYRMDTQVRLGKSKDTNTSVAIAPQIVKVSEKEYKTKEPPKYPHSKEVFGLWGSWPRNWLLNTTQLRAAENLYEERGLDEIKDALQFIKDYGNADFFPSITSPYDLDSKWAKLEAKSKELAKKL